MIDIIYLPDGKKDCFAACDADAFAALVRTYMGPEAEAAFRDFSVPEPYGSSGVSNLMAVIDNERERANRYRERLTQLEKQLGDAVSENHALRYKIRDLALAAGAIVAASEKYLD